MTRPLLKTGALIFPQTCQRQAFSGLTVTTLFLCLE